MTKSHTPDLVAPTEGDMQDPILQEILARREAGQSAMSVVTDHGPNGPEGSHVEHSEPASSGMSVFDRFARPDSGWWAFDLLRTPMSGQTRNSVKQRLARMAEPFPAPGQSCRIYGTSTVVLDANQTPKLWSPSPEQKARYTVGPDYRKPGVPHLVFVVVPEDDKSYRPVGEVAAAGGAYAAILYQPWLETRHDDEGTEFKQASNSRFEFLAVRWFATEAAAVEAWEEARDAVYAANESARAEAQELNEAMRAAEREERLIARLAAEQSKAVVQDDAPF